MHSVQRMATLLLLGGSLCFSSAAPASRSVPAQTTLADAVSAGDREQAKARLAAGDDVNGFDKAGWTPLMWAVFDRHLELTEFLLAQGADPDLQAQRARRGLAKGATALIIASYFGQDLQAAALLEKGARPEIADDKGRTAMSYATEFEFRQVQVLLAKAAGGALPALTEGEKSELGPDVDLTPLAKSYARLVADPFKTAPEFTRDYPTAMAECQAGAMGLLALRKGFERAEMKQEGQTLEEDTLLLQVEVLDMRITSSAARIWAGVLARKSYLHVAVKLVDASTGKVEREQRLRSENSVWGAAMTMGSTDRSLPMDMGRIIAGYVLTVAGKQ